MAAQHRISPELKSFLSTQLLFTRMGEPEASSTLEFLGSLDPDDPAMAVTDPAELVGV